MKRFWKEETGAVTVDWVVITAAVVALCIATMNTIGWTIYDLAVEVTVAMNAD